MLIPQCDICGEAAPTVFATYRFRERDIKIALCDVCTQEELPTELLEQKVAHLPMEYESEFDPSATLYVVIEVCRSDDDFSPYPETTPIAVFVSEAHAAAFVASKRSKEYIHLDWDIVPTPFIELLHHGSEKV
jgi:hypothetical protein